MVASSTPRIMVGVVAASSRDVGSTTTSIATRARGVGSHASAFVGSVTTSQAPSEVGCPRGGSSRS